MSKEKKSSHEAKKPEPESTAKKPRAREKHEDYWRANLILVATLMFIWFLFGCVFSIFLVEDLNKLGRLGGFPLGFWVAQQGTIVVFFGLVTVYAVTMKKLDRKYDVEEEE